MSGRRTRVVYLGHSAALSGAELALLRLLPHVPDLEPLVVLAEEGPLVARLTAAGVPTEVLPMARRTATLGREALHARGVPLTAAVDVAGYLVRLRRHVRRADPDIIHTNSNKAHLYGGLVARSLRVPQVWHVRDRVAVEFMPRAAVHMVRGAVRVLPTAVVGNSASTLATVSGAPLPRGADSLLRDPVLRADFEGVHPPAPPPVVVGMLGRLTPWKGQDLFLRAFARASAGTGARARIIGSALFGEEQYAEGLRRLAVDLMIADRVDFTGFVEDVPAALGCVHVLVHASVIPEPFGQVVVEGLAAGLPVLASAEGGPAEVISHDVDGLLYVPRDEAALASQLRRLILDEALRYRLAVAARRRSADFDPAPIGEQLAAVYRGVLSE